MSWQDRQDRRLRIERWSRSHAASMLAACGVSLGVGHGWPLSAAALVSFVVLVQIGAGAWTPRGDFGAPNLVTGLRLAATAAIGFGWVGGPSLALAALVLVLLVLDGVDGWLARRTGRASEFGAHFDMEVDALMVLTIELALWQGAGFGAWILITGLLRYVYVLALALVPARRAELPRSRFGRFAFTALMIGLIAALALPHAIGVFAAAVGTVLVSASFARAFRWSYRAPADREAGAADLRGAAPGR
jgi:phosphatidylglycerophosphate synthase